MLNVASANSGALLVLTLSGEINETFDLKDFVAGNPSQVRVNCREVSRINSPGVKAWIGFFGSTRATKFQLAFSECSVPIVEQINLIRNFVCHGKVESICVPYFCDGCSKALTLVMRVQDIVSGDFQPKPLKCTCGGQAEFDDIPEEYFAFLQGP